MAIDNMTRLIEGFFSSVNASDGKGGFKIYIEASLQFELGTYLRANLPKGYNVEVERNVHKKPVSEEDNAVKFAKERIDLFIYSDDNTEKYAIELKYPRNGAYPKRYGQFIEDIKFMDQVAGLPCVQKTYCLTVATDSKFYSGNIKKGVNEAKYRLFRTQKKPDVADMPKDSGKSVEDSYKVVKRHHGDGINGLVIEWNMAKDKEKNLLYQRDGEDEKLKDKSRKKKRKNRTTGNDDTSNNHRVYFYLIEIDGRKSNGGTSNS